MLLVFEHGDTGCMGWCAILLILLYCGYSVMVGLFLWAPFFSSAPYTLGATEFKYCKRDKQENKIVSVLIFCLLSRFPNANYVNATCRINGYISNQGSSIFVFVSFVDVSRINRIAQACAILTPIATTLLFAPCSTYP